MEEYKSFVGVETIYTVGLLAENETIIGTYLKPNLTKKEKEDLILNLKKDIERLEKELK